MNLKEMNSKKIIALFCISALITFSNSWAKDIVQLQTFKTHSRLTFKIDSNIPTEWKTTSQGFDLLLKGMSLSDLGAQLHHGSKGKSIYEELHDIRLHHLKFEETLEGLHVKGLWKFPNGIDELEKPEMEYFDYHERRPSQYVIDFWIKKGPTKIEMAKKNQQDRLLAIIKKTKENEQNKLTRKIANEKIQAQAESTTYFCELKMDPEKEVFLEFYPAHKGVDYSQWFFTHKADSTFHYFIPKEQSLEAQYVKKAIELYHSDHPALCVRAIQFLEDEFPNSKYMEQMIFLKSNAFNQLGYKNEAEKLLKKSYKDAKDKEISLSAAHYLLGNYLKSNSYLQSLELLNWLIRNNISPEIKWAYHLATGECLYHLKQTNEAAKEYQWVIQHAKDPVIQADASIRLGNLYLSRFKYEQALALYSRTLSYFPNEAKKNPIFLLNRGETFYQLSEFKKSKDVFEDFLKQYPSHSSGWRAAFRLGEIYGREAQVGESGKKSREWFYETINSYPLSPGATLARMRLMPCYDHGGFSYQSQKRFYEKDVNEFKGNGEVVTKNFSDFKALSHVRSLIGLAPLKQIAYGAIEEIRNTKNKQIKDIISQTASVFFKKLILTLISENKKYEALSILSTQKKLLPTPKNAIEGEYLLRSSQVASEIGLGSMAKELMSEYESILNPTPQNLDSSTDRKIAHESSQNVQIVDLETEMKNSEIIFLKAKALWIAAVSQGSAPPLENIRELLKNVRNESPYEFFKEVLLALTYLKESKNTNEMNKSILTLLAKTQLNEPNVRIQSWIASLYLQLGEKKASLELYRQIEKKMILHKKINKNSTDIDPLDDFIEVPPLPSLEDVVLSQGHILELDQRWGEAAATYARGMENGIEKDQLTYEYAKTLIKTGKTLQISKAIETLKKLSETKPADQASSKNKTSSQSESFWKRLAQETLNNNESIQSVIKSRQGGQK